MRIAFFQDLNDRRLMSEEKCIESLTFSLLITKSHHFQKSDNIWAGGEAQFCQLQLFTRIAKAASNKCSLSRV